MKAVSIVLKGAGALVDRLNSEDLRAKKKEWLANRCEEVLLKAVLPGVLGVRNRAALFNAGVLDLCYDILNIWKQDVIICLIVIKILLAMVKTAGVAENIIQRSGDKMIAMIYSNLYDDKEIRVVGRLLIDKINSKGSKSGRDWIQQLERHLAYGVPLNAVDEVMGAVDDKKSSAKIFPTRGEVGYGDGSDSSEGAIEKLMLTMGKYKDVESLQLDGLEVLLFLAKKQTGVHAITRVNGFASGIESAMSAHTKSEEVLWRCCVLVTELGRELSACIDIGRSGVCKSLIDLFVLSTCRTAGGVSTSSPSEAVKQHALFAISALCRERTYCVPEFETLDIKILLFDLLISGSSTYLVVPLPLRSLYPQEVLQDAKRYWTGREKVATGRQETKVRGLPKNPVFPMNGTAEDYFAEPGDPGLI